MFDLADHRRFERPQLFYLNIEMVVKRGFSEFWWWLCREVLLYFEIPLEKFTKPFRFSKQLTKLQRTTRWQPFSQHY